jgi:hypothetical protein
MEGSVIISLRNFVGEEIQKNVDAIRSKTS